MLKLVAESKNSLEFLLCLASCAQASPICCMGASYKNMHAPCISPHLDKNFIPMDIPSNNF